MGTTSTIRAIEKTKMVSSIASPLLPTPLIRSASHSKVSSDKLELAADLLYFSDFIIMFVAMILTVDLTKMTYDGDSISNSIRYALLVLLSTPLIIRMYDLYKMDTILSPVRTIWATGSAYVTALAISLIFFSAAGGLAERSMLWGGLWLSSGFILCAVSRVGLAGVAARLARRGVLRDSVAIVGGGPRAATFLTHLAKSGADSRRCPVEVVGIFDDRRSRGRFGGPEIAGTVDDLVALGRNGALDRVVVTLPWSAEQRLMALRSKLQALAVDVSLCPDDVDSLDAGAPEESFQPALGELPLYPLAQRPLGRWSAIAKRAEDIVVSSMALAFLGPLMLIVAFAVKLDSPGPALFRQRRHGFNNREIDVYKFRSMRTDMADPTGGAQTKRGDQRITRIGGFLRRTSIDELPQLLNVLRGDMSLVGPRPHPVGMRTKDKLCHEIVETYAHRHRVKPGITGWAQINGCRGATSEPEQLRRRVDLDLYYIDHWSVLFDLKIMVQTAYSLIATENAF
jgi:polysaccharide biosynthesis protein PslA